MSESLDVGQKLVAELFKRDDAGRRVYTDDEVSDLMAVLLIQGKLRGSEIPSNANGILGAFAFRIGVKPELGGNQPNLPRMISEYLKKNPLNAQLMKNVTSILQTRN